MKIKNYLSHGGGVDSTAQMILMINNNIEFESVFVNHGGDYPETYKYIEYLNDNGYKITTIKPDYYGHNTIESWCLEKKVIPTQKGKVCAHRFKIEPIQEYVANPCFMYIGFNIDEYKRTYNQKLHKGIINRYYLIEQNIGRNQCVKIIESAGLKVPQKSGCWFCPSASGNEIRNLQKNYPDLFNRRRNLELNCKKKMYISDKPIDEIVKKSKYKQQSIEI